MIKGMTGYGSQDFSSGKIKGSVEIKSLNHRYLDISYYLPPGFTWVENKIRDLLAQKIERGRVTVAVKITHKPSGVSAFNQEAARAYLKYAKIFKKELGVKGELSLSDLIQLPGVVDSKEAVLDTDNVWPGIEKSLAGALNGLLEMRRREGKSLAADIHTQLKRMLLQIKQIQSRAKIILAEKKKILSQEEFSSVQKSSDVNEELARMAHHIEELKLLLKSDAAMGKKIDFIAQEMQRETNTIGSKLQDKVVSHAVIAVKSKIEKIREQSQNIE